MFRPLPLFALASFSLALGLAGCSGSSTPLAPATPVTQNFGSLTTRLLGSGPTPVTSSVSGTKITGIAGATVDRLALNNAGSQALRGTKILYSSYGEGKGGIYLMNADGADQTRLTNGSWEGCPSWSPDGSKIVFASNRDGDVEIYVMNADGTEQTRLTNSRGFDTDPSWSPDGSKIAFSSWRDADPQVYVMDADGANQTRLTNRPGVQDGYPSWSPNGSKIAFSSYSYDDYAGKTGVHVMNADGTNLTRLTFSGQMPTWSPDGGKIAFASLENDNRFQISVMNADGTNRNTLTSGHVDSRNPNWSPDGTRIAFARSRADFPAAPGDIYAMNADGTAQTKLTSDDTPNCASPSWSGYLSSASKPLIGADGVLGSSAAGVLFSQKETETVAVVAFDTRAATSRRDARVATQGASLSEGGSSLLYSIATSAGLANLRWVRLDAYGKPEAVVSPALPEGSGGALVSFRASQGTVASVIPYASNRRTVPASTFRGSQATYTGSFTAIFDADGKNLAPQGAKTVVLDTTTGNLVRFE